MMDKQQISGRLNNRRWFAIQSAIGLVGPLVLWRFWGQAVCKVQPVALEPASREIKMVNSWSTTWSKP